MLKKFLGAVLVVLLAASLCPARTIEGVDLPETMEVGGETVALNGGGVRKSMYLKTYVGGLYMQGAETEAAAVMNADKPMAIRLHMIEDVGQETMKTACYNGFRGATGDNIEPIESRIDKFMEAFSDAIKKEDIFDFKYVPGQGTKIYKQGERLSTIKGLDFKKAMFGIWFSEQPADKALKENMLAGDIRVSPEKLQPESAMDKASAGKAAAARAKAERAAKEKAAAEAKQQKMRAEASAAKTGDEAAESAGVAGAATAAAGAKAVADEKAAEEKADVQADGKSVPKKTSDKPEQVKTAVVETKSAPQKPAKTAEEKAGQKAEGKSATSVSWAQVAGEDIYFEVNDASLSDQALRRLARKVKWLEANPEASVIVEVYCDPRGSENYNKWLAHKRGRSVKTYLVNEGIAPSRVRVKVRGENDQKYQGRENWEKNRRAHFKVRK